jgi:branched-chain amino acid transport system ATP-binding protein
VAALLTVEGLSKRFGGLRAVRELSLAVDQGEILALIGPNGAGKTTVFALLSGFLTPDAGDVRLRGRSLLGLKPHQICALGLARTFQIVRPFPHLSVLRNVTVGALARHPRPADAESRARAVLEEVGLAGRSEQRAGSLTLADRKRLELARALATEPTLLLLDEVMAGLTAAETQRVVELVAAINRRGVTIVLIEHVMRAVMALSGRIVVINYGERIAEGRPDAIATNPLVIQAYLGEPAVTAAPVGVTRGTDETAVRAPAPPAPSRPPPSTSHDGGSAPR